MGDPHGRKILDQFFVGDWRAITLLEHDGAKVGRPRQSMFARNTSSVIRRWALAQCTPTALEDRRKNVFAGARDCGH